MLILCWICLQCGLGWAVPLYVQLPALHHNSTVSISLDSYSVSDRSESLKATLTLVIESTPSPNLVYGCPKLLNDIQALNPGMSIATNGTDWDIPEEATLPSSNVAAIAPYCRRWMAQPRPRTYVLPTEDSIIDTTSTLLFPHFGLTNLIASSPIQANRKDGSYRYSGRTIEDTVVKVSTTWKGLFTIRLDHKKFPFDEQLIAFEIDLNVIEPAPSPAFLDTFLVASIKDEKPSVPQSSTDSVWTLQRAWSTMQDPNELEFGDRQRYTFFLLLDRNSGDFVRTTIVPVNLMLVVMFCSPIIPPGQLMPRIGATFINWLAMQTMKARTAASLPAIQRSTWSKRFFNTVDFYMFVGLMELLAAQFLFEVYSKWIAQRLDRLTMVMLPLCFFVNEIILLSVPEWEPSEYVIPIVFLFTYCIVAAVYGYRITRNGVFLDRVVFDGVKCGKLVLEDKEQLRLVTLLDEDCGGSVECNEVVHMLLPTLCRKTELTSADQNKIRKDVERKFSGSMFATELSTRFPPLLRELHRRVNKELGRACDSDDVSQTKLPDNPISYFGQQKPDTGSRRDSFSAPMQYQFSSLSRFEHGQNAFSEANQPLEFLIPEDQFNTYRWYSNVSFRHTRQSHTYSGWHHLSPLPWTS
eukprot:NODE_711_length_2159_cov_131.784381_g678_i0.p1 GENE.NODE_711_length_2159_cov_131.784381_g678_i0~~NODE_711_length_2159_cov_131.784381_g678_i0.p1  ORF type:complete len:638 (-),score=119.83 NODE_711_length_2159_cov_131.784381_g678_i0:183-2096(-)